MNNFHIYEEIGRGNYSVVYKGRKKKTIEYVAVKSVQRDRRRKLMSEVRIFHNLQHQNVLKFHNWYETRNHLWIIFEYCPGGDLRRLLDEDKILPEKSVRQFAYDLCLGLTYLHENGIIHGEVAPRNILLNEFSRLKFADFGLSKKIQDLIPSANQSAEGKTPAGASGSPTEQNGQKDLGASLGSATGPQPNISQGKAHQQAGAMPYYMAPELFTEAGVLSFASDFWTLGILLFEMAAGKVPFQAQSLRSLVQMIQEHEVPQITKCSKEFNDLVQNLLKKDPLQRPTWSEIKKHAFWQERNKFQKHTMYPEQPHFEQYAAQNRGIPDLTAFYKSRIDPQPQTTSLDRVQKPLANQDQATSQDQRLLTDIQKNSQQTKSKLTLETIKDKLPVTSLHKDLIKTPSNSNFIQNQSDLTQATKTPNEGIVSDEKQSKLIMTTEKLIQNSESNNSEHKSLQKDNSSSGLISLNAPTGQSEKQDPQLMGVDTPQDHERVKDTYEFQKGTDLTSEFLQQSNQDKQDQPKQRPLTAIGQKPQQSSNKTNNRRADQILNNNFMASGSNSSTQPQKKVQSKSPSNGRAIKSPLLSKQQTAKTLLPSATLGGVNSGGIGIQTHSGMNDNPCLTNQIGAYTPQATSGLLSITTPSSLNPPATSITPTSQTLQTLKNAKSQNQLIQFNPKTPQTIRQQQQAQQRYQQQGAPVLKSSMSDLQLIASGTMFPSISSTNSTQASSTSSTPPKGVSQKTVSQLLLHNSDSWVKPIIGNTDIEKEVILPTLLPTNLVFEPWPVQKITQLIDSPEIEVHLTEIYKSLAGQSTVNEKLNTLVYFESIIVNSNVSNRLINSMFVSQLVKMLQQVKSPGVKQRLCSVIGLLVRHSTVIDAELAQSDVCSVLILTLDERSEKVRRRAIAALGEYMFYAATQLDDDSVDPAWLLSQQSIQTITHCLRVHEEDDIVRFYACKTLENITAQSNQAGMKFCMYETVAALIGVFKARESELMRTVRKEEHPPTFYEAIRQSATVALQHICRLRPGLFAQIYDGIGPRDFFVAMLEDQPRIQQALITMLNLVLESKEVPALSQILLATADNFLPSIVKLQEHQSIVIRGKCLLTLLLLFKRDFKWLSVAHHTVNIFSVLERVVRDSYKYVQQCLVCLIDGTVNLVPQIFQVVADTLMQLTQNQKGSLTQMPQASYTQTMSNGFSASSSAGANGNGQPGSNDLFIQNLPKSMQAQLYKQGGNLFWINTILDLQANNFIRNKMLTGTFIRALATLLDHCTVAPSLDTIQEFQNTVLLVAESLSANAKLLCQLRGQILTYLLPVLMAKCYRNNGNEDETRFLSLKIMTDILVTLIEMDQRSQSSQQQQQYQADSTFLTFGQLRGELIQLAGGLLNEPSPVPFYGQRLLTILIERQGVTGSRGAEVQKSLAQRLLEFYTPGHQNLNKHTIRCVKAILPSLTLQDVLNLKLVGKTTNLIGQNFKSQPVQEWCLDLLLDINQGVLLKLHEVTKHISQQTTSTDKNASQIQPLDQLTLSLCDQVFNNFDLTVQMLAACSAHIQEKASQNLIQLLQLYALCQDERAAPLQQQPNTLTINNHHYQNQPSPKNTQQRPFQQVYFQEQHLSCLLTALKQNDKRIVQKRVLKCIYWALIQCEYTITLQKEQHDQLLSFVTRVIHEAQSAAVDVGKGVNGQSGADAGMAKTCNEIYKKLREANAYVNFYGSSGNASNAVAKGVPI